MQVNAGRWICIIICPIKQDIMCHTNVNMRRGCPAIDQELSSYRFTHRHKWGAAV